MLIKPTAKKRPKNSKHLEPYHYRAHKVEARKKKRDTNLRGLRANDGEVSGHPEYEVFHLDKVVSADAGGFIH